MAQMPFVLKMFIKKMFISFVTIVECIVIKFN